MIGRIYNHLSDAGKGREIRTLHSFKFICAIRMVDLKKIYFINSTFRQTISEELLFQ